MVHNKSNLSLSNRRQSSFFNQLPPAEPDVYYIGVDVGTGSARACLIDTNGIILGLAERPIKRQELQANYITQNSTEIWNAICYCVKSCLRDSGVDALEVFGIGFDATCSLVAISKLTDEPDEEENIILWMDHRAVDETNTINATGDKCLKYVDFLVHKATGWKPEVTVLSPVSKVSSHSVLKAARPLVEDDFIRLGGIPGKNGKYLTAGDVVGNLTEKSAQELGLTTDCIVGSPVIDAYAGWVGTVAAKAEVPILQQEDAQSDGSIGTACGRLAAVAGTSTCHLAMTKEPCFVHGVWGPYKNVMAEGYWLAEGGQSITGQLLAHVLSIHPANQTLIKTKHERSVVSLAKHMFFYGDFHGNRSPIADPRMRASIIGQSMDNSIEDLALQYFGACEFIAQQTRQIIEEMEKSGHNISSIFMSGGQCRNGLLMRLYIDAAVVFGSALLGAVAAEAAQPPQKGAVKDDDDSEDEATLSFGSKTSHQQGVKKKLDAKATNTQPGSALWRTMVKLTDPDRNFLTKVQVFLEQCESQRRFRDMVDKVEELNLKNATKAAA
ncbi:hypothetical protein Cantr_07291 [Candida viswanathii]|uniref:Protein MPA43 n=1 Tax=Candida viswanathii TaxID=5486 RepID=A0A367XZ43_9ASCO|nr:hypothetical protein Cantr_07291 [Candida viswanathii]